jgi:hypothetical protein
LVTMAIKINFPCYPYSFHINDWLDSKIVKWAITDSTHIPPKLWFIAGLIISHLKTYNFCNWQLTVIRGINM